MTAGSSTGAVSKLSCKRCNGRLAIASPGSCKNLCTQHLCTQLSKKAVLPSCMCMMVVIQTIGEVSSNSGSRQVSQYGCMLMYICTEAYLDACT